MASVALSGSILGMTLSQSLRWAMGLIQDGRNPLACILSELRYPRRYLVTEKTLFAWEGVTVNGRYAREPAVGERAHRPSGHLLTQQVDNLREIF
jgi:hypothetical protein